MIRTICVVSEYCKLVYTLRNNNKIAIAIALYCTRGKRIFLQTIEVAVSQKTSFILKKAPNNPYPGIPKTDVCDIFSSRWGKDSL